MRNFCKSWSEESSQRRQLRAKQRHSKHSLPPWLSISTPLTIWTLIDLFCQFLLKDKCKSRSIWLLDSWTGKIYSSIELQQFFISIWTIWKAPMTSYSPAAEKGAKQSLGLISRLCARLWPKGRKGDWINWSVSKAINRLQNNAKSPSAQNRIDWENLLYILLMRVIHCSAKLVAQLFGSA